MDWKAAPPWDPSIAVEGAVAYVSWNGATEVATWVVVSTNLRYYPSGRD